MRRALEQAMAQLWRNRSGAGPVIAVMALSIGSCAAIFSVVSAVLLEDLGYRDAGRLGVIWHARPAAAGVIGVSPGDFVSYRSTLSTFDQIAAVTTRGFNLGGSPAPSRVTCARMTDGMFPLLGVGAAHGRWFAADEDRAEARVVVVSHRLWTTRFGGEEGLIGRNVVLDAIRYRVVGIMPEGFTFPPEGVQGLASADCWIPAGFTSIDLATPAFNYVLIGRLKPGVLWEQAGADAHAGAQKIWSSYPAAVQSQVQLTARVIPLTEQVVAGSRTALYLFAGSVAMLLLIGCANVSNLLLASFDIRRRELAVRASLGATRAVLILQLLTESILLTLMGAVAGIALAYALLGAMVSVNAAAFPRLGNARIDVIALGFAAVCGMVAGLAGGLAPAIRAGSQSVSGNGTGPRSVTRGVAGDRWRRGLIGFELALAVVVLVLAGVLTRSVISLDRVDIGLAVDNLTTFSVSLPAEGYEHPTAAGAFSERLLSALRAYPGVTDAAAGTSLPIGDAEPGVVVALTATPSADYRPTLIYSVTPGYAKAFGIPIRRGRFLEPADAGPVGNVAVINETLARSLWPDGLATGRSISHLGSPSPLQVVGVVADVRQSGPHRVAAPALYLPLSQAGRPTRSLSFVIRSAEKPSAVASQVRRAVAIVDAGLPAFGLRTGAEMVRATTTVQRFNMVIVGMFAALAAALAMTGLYGVVTRSVEEAQRDFGIRQALGATTGAIVRLVMTLALTPVMAGAATGALAAWWAVELVSSLLFGVRPADPATFAVTIGFVCVTSALVVLMPALRATRANLVTLLRQD